MCLCVCIMAEFFKIHVSSFFVFLFPFSFSPSPFLSDWIVFTQQLSCCSNIYCQATHLSITALKSLSFTPCSPSPSYSL